MLVTSPNIVRSENPTPLLEWLEKLRGNCYRHKGFTGNWCWYHPYVHQVLQNSSHLSVKRPMGQTVLCSYFPSHTDFLFINHMLSTVSSLLHKVQFLCYVTSLDKKYIGHCQVIRNRKCKFSVSYVNILFDF
jgi:hypothetical protein